MPNHHSFSNSSFITSCDYDDEKCILTIGMRDKEYKYADVPKPVYEDLVAAESPGKFFSGYIKGVFLQVAE